MADKDLSLPTAEHWRAQNHEKLGRQGPIALPTDDTTSSHSGRQSIARFIPSKRTVIIIILAVLSAVLGSLLLLHRQSHQPVRTLVAYNFLMYRDGACARASGNHNGNAYDYNCAPLDGGNLVYGAKGATDMSTAIVFYTDNACSHIAGSIQPGNLQLCIPLDTPATHFRIIPFGG